MKRPGSRAIKNEVLTLLRKKSFEEAIAGIRGFAPKRVIGPLFSHFYGNDLVFWRAVSAMGIVVAGMADDGDVESARIILRRMMWQLNDESGGIGWGCPEAMGDITARNERLAEEFHQILTSYAMADGNFLEHPVLQRGLLWGIGRLAHARTGLISYAAPHLTAYLSSADPIHRGMAAWALIPLVPFADEKTIAALHSLADDGAAVIIYAADRLTERTVAAIARQALSRIS